MKKLTLTAAFANYGAKLKNVQWAFSAIANDGALVISGWQHFLNIKLDGSKRYKDRLSQLQDKRGRNLLENHLREAIENNLPVRLVVATLDNPKEHRGGKANARSLPKTFSIEQNLIGKIIEFDGDTFIIEFKQVIDEENLNILQEIEQLKDSYANLPKTTRESVIQSRIGQGLFRTNLIRYWQGCSVSGCKNIELLKASHIKPWRVSSNVERLDVFNGLLLLPNLDACFDLGLITFNDEGEIAISPKLDTATQLQVNINSGLKLRRVDERHKDFLRYHRENVFISGDGAG